MPFMLCSFWRMLQSRDGEYVWIDERHYESGWYSRASVWYGDAQFILEEFRCT